MRLILTLNSYVLSYYGALSKQTQRAKYHQKRSTLKMLVGISQSDIPTRRAYTAVVAIATPGSAVVKLDTRARSCIIHIGAISTPTPIAMMKRMATNLPNNFG